MTKTELMARMEEIAAEDIKATGSKLAFTDMWIPDRWFRGQGDKGGFVHRCENDHVSRVGLSIDEGGILCLDCYCQVVWTFPEDRNGPLEESWKKLQESRK